MNDAIEAYLALIELLLITAVPVLGMLTIYSWWLAYSRRPYKLALVIAVKNSVILVAASWLAWSVLYRYRVGEAVPVEYLPITATAVLLCVVAPFFTTAYLAWLDARHHDAVGEHRPNRRRADETD